MTLPGMTLVGSEEEERRYYLRKRLQEATTPQVFTAEEARLVGMDISGVGEDWQDWMVKIAPDETRETGYFASYVSPEGYEFGEDMSVKTPEGKLFTEEEWRIETGDLEEIEMGPPAPWQPLTWAPPGAPAGVVIGGPRLWQGMAKQELETILREGVMPWKETWTVPALGKEGKTFQETVVGRKALTPSQRQQVEQALRGLDVGFVQAEAERTEALTSRLERSLAGFAQSAPQYTGARWGREAYHADLLKLLEESGLTAEQRMRVLGATKVPLIQRDPGGRLITTPFQLPAPEQTVSNLLRQYAPSIIFPAENPWSGLVELREVLLTDADAAIAWIREQGASDDLKQLIWAAVPEATGEDIDLWLGSIRSQAIQEMVVEVIPEIFPALADMKPEAVLNWVIDNQTEFMERLHDMGETPESAALMRAFYPSLTQQEIRQFFKEDTRGWFGKFWGSLVAGVGTLYQTVGGGLNWLGGPFKYMGEPAAGFGEFLQKEIPTSSMGWSFVSQAPIQLALFAAGFGGWTLASRVAMRAGVTTATRLGAFANYIIKITGFTAASRSLESFMEAGGAYEQAIRQGMSRGEASGVAGEVFRKNLALVGVDFVQFATMFLPFASFKVLPSLFQKGLVRVVKPTMGVGFVALTEGGEEYYQEIVQNQALGVEVKFWDLTTNLSEEEYRQVFILGAMWGGVMATGANVVAVIAKAVPQNLSAELKAEFNKKKAEGVRQGMSLQEAEMVALDMIAETTEGKKAIDGVVEAYRVEWYRGQIKPKTAPEATIWNDRLNDMRPEGIVGIPVGYVQMQPVGAEQVREPYAEYAQGIEAKYAGLPEAPTTCKIAENIRDGVKVTPEQVESFLSKRTKSQALKHIASIEAAIGDQTGDVIETYRYESVEEGQRYEAYLDSLLEVTQKYRQKHGMPLTMKAEEAAALPVPAEVLADYPELAGLAVRAELEPIIRTAKIVESDLAATSEAIRILSKETKPTADELGLVTAALQDAGVSESDIAQLAEIGLPPSQQIDIWIQKLRVAQQELQQELTQAMAGKFKTIPLPAPVEGMPEAGLISREPTIEPTVGLQPETLALAEQVKVRLAAIEAETTQPSAIPESQTEAIAASIEEVKGLRAMALEEAAELKTIGAEEVEFKMVQAELAELKKDVAFFDKTIKALEAEAKTMPRPKMLRQTIMAWAKFKGLPETQYRRLFKEHGDSVRLTNMNEEQLQKVLVAIKKARPVTIKGKHIITAKTEKKIASLKATLLRDKQLTEESFKRLLRNLKLRTTKYESVYRFITEKEGKSLIRAMNDEAPLVAWEIKVEESLAASPEILRQWQEIYGEAQRERETSIAGEKIKIRRGNELRSMRYYAMMLQREMGAPIYDIWQKINMVHLVIHKKLQGYLDSIVDSIGKDQFKAIAEDEAALKRVEDWIASKHKMSGIKKPTDITASEIAMAEEMERQLFDWRNPVRYARFTEAYIGHGGDLDGIAADIPDAPREALRRALDVFEGQGADKLRAFLDTQEWGVKRSGYDPWSVVKPHLHLHKAKATTFAKGHIQTREGTVYEQQERNILDRYRSYTKQLLGLTELAPLMRSLDRVFTENAGKLEKPGEVASALSRALNEMKGYHEDGGYMVHVIERLYGQVAATVFWRPDLVLRNKFQNWAFNPDFHRGLVFHPGNKPMSAERRAWFEVFVVQDRGIVQDFLFRYQKPLPGFDRMTRFANRTSLFPWSDKSNRAEAYYVRMNRVDRALARYRKDGDVKKLIKDSGLVDLEARQQAEALELLAMESVDYGVPGMPSVTGQEAFARYNAQQLVNNVHFLYDRAQRSVAEMLAAGRTLGNIMTFQRSWAERLILQANALRPGSKASFAKKLYAAQVIVGIIVAGLIAGQVYKKITGKRMNPYNPLNILTYSPGGLMIGVTEDISNVIYLLTEASQGNSFAMGKLPAAITGAADLVVPFYRNFWQALEAGVDQKYLDMDMVRRIRELIDDDYTRNRNASEVDRNLVESLQHALLGGEAPPQTLQEKLAEAEERLGEAIEDDDLLFSIEDPRVYGMSKLSADIGRIMGDTPLADILKGDYSALTKAWAEKEQSEVEVEGLPSQPLYKVENIYAETKVTKRQIDLIQQYHALPEDEQEAFLEEHPELKVDLRDEWLRSHPEDNARLALWGQAKILTEEAYNALIGMMETLDIPDALVTGIPPKKIAPAHFERQELLQEFSASSSEALLFLLENPEYQEWAGLSKPKNNIEVLRINVQYREEDDIYESLPAGSEREAYLIENSAKDEYFEGGYAEARRRRDAYELEIPDEFIETYVEYYMADLTGNDRIWWLKKRYPFYEMMVDLGIWKPGKLVVQPVGMEYVNPLW